MVDLGPRLSTLISETLAKTRLTSQDRVSISNFADHESSHLTTEEKREVAAQVAEILSCIVMR